MTGTLTDRRVLGMTPAERKLFLAIDALAYFASKLAEAPSNVSARAGLRESRTKLRLSAAELMAETQRAAVLQQAGQQCTTLHALTRIGMGE